jgi:broad specificity phosphatase PhoE
MESSQPRHLVLVRHGESEGDVRRKLGAQAFKHPNDENQTEQGHNQSEISGRWIAKYIMQAYGLEQFDRYLTSPLIRTRQSAKSLGLSSNWLAEPKLSERNRGDIQGLTKQQHQKTFPDNYQTMLDHPFFWVPPGPGGESILAVSHRFNELKNDLTDIPTVLIMTHRDVLWSAHIPLDGLTLTEIESVNTDLICNGQVIHYTNVNPDSKMVDSTEFVWKRSTNPPSNAAPEETGRWIQIIKS